MIVCENKGPFPGEIGDITSFVHNYQVSVVVPFFRKMKEFREILPLNARYFSRNGIEVIIVMDENSEQEELLAFIKEYPFINWRVIVNTQKHEWRNPVKAINVGIRQATKKYVMVCSPESQFFTDAIYIMRKMLHYYDRHFAIGTVAFATQEDIDSGKMMFNLPYGSIMAKKKDLEVVGGYDESLCLWGGDDDNIRARLQMSGIKQLFLPEVQLIHKEKSDADVKKRHVSRMSLQDALRLSHPAVPIANAGKEWGRDFDTVVYDWENNQYSQELLEKYLMSFEKYELKKEACHVNYSRIVLVQIYNGEKWLSSFLKNMELYFDGIIVLDDDSTDDTFAQTCSEKLLLKAKKKRDGFQDVENRNILLRLASFFSPEWFCMMDVDELFDSRFADFAKATADPLIDTLIFRHIHLWNHCETYNGQYPFSRQGILERDRMFRNIGSCQILTNKKKLHCSAIPYHGRVFRSEILYHHLGNIEQADRQRRFDMYQQEDIYRDQSDYSHLVNHAPKLLNVEDIYLKEGNFYNEYDFLI